jgi:hypothetical protein
MRVNQNQALKSTFKAFLALFSSPRVHQQIHRQQKDRFRHGLSHGQAANQHAKNGQPIG